MAYAIHESDWSQSSELICAFLDGETDDGAEESLFRQLSDSADLRAELREHLLMQRLVVRDADSMTPATRLKTGIDGTLGISRGAAGEGFVGPVPLMHSLSRYWGVVAGYVGSIAVTALIMYALFAPQEHTVEVGAGREAAHAPSLSDMGSGSDAPRVLQRGVDEPGMPEGAPLATASKGPGSPNSGIAQSAGSHNAEIPVTAQFGADSLSDAATPNDSSNSANMPPANVLPDAMRLAHASSMSAVPHNAAFTLLNSQRSELRPHFSDIAAADALFAAGAQPRLALTFRGLRNDSYPQVDQEPQSRPLFRDLAIGAFWRISESSMLGVEAGQETFGQKFRGTEQDRGVTFFQNPMLFWAGAAFQYNAVSLAPAPGVHPFIKAFAGGSRLGPMARASLGIRYYPGSRLAVTIGLDGGLLLYRFQNVWFSSKKYGITYGVSLML